MPPPALHDLTIRQAADALRRRELSPVDLTEAVLDRVRRLDGVLNAYITVTEEAALAQARAAEREIAAGTYRGPLHGIPLAYKDLFATRGVRTTAGSRLLAGWVPDYDAEAVARLHAAGAVMLGKLNLHEFAYGVTTANPHYGPCRNPWDTTRSPGGSSGGSGAAVAAGLALGALGTDTGGSIRIPAALCGVVGLKPTYGRVSRHGVVPLAWSLDHVGPLARTVEDAALLLAAVAGFDPKDPAAADAPVPDYAAALAGDARGLRAGVLGGHFTAGADPEVLAALAAAVQTLEGCGVRTDGAELDHAGDALTAATCIMFSEASAYHERDLRERPEDYGPDVRARLELGELYRATDYLRAQRARTVFVQEVLALLDRFDVLVAPATPVPAPPIEGGDPAARLVQYTSPFNLAGLPAVSVPCGFTAAGLPVGMMLVGRPFEEATVLRAAAAYQGATDWHRRRPPL
ncbi:MAG TPA: amidase [Dehalococcoidia bacterium]